MQMVSSSKLNRMDNILLTVRPYFGKIVDMLDNVLAGVEEYSSPYIQERKVKTGKICLCVITSDGGLCGVYNNNILRVADDFIRQRGEENIKLLIIGKKGFNYFRRRSNLEIINSYIGLNGKFSETVAKQMLSVLVDTYLYGKVDEVYIAYTHFITAINHKPLVDKFLNFTHGKGKAYNYIFDPNRDVILEQLIPLYIGAKFRITILESFTSEHAARAVAMKMATENARDMIDSLTLLRNKVRQAKITEEMLEIISSVEALKG